MDKIEEFYKTLDLVDFSANDNDFDLNTDFIKLLGELELEKDERANIVNREREALLFVKTAENGLQPKMTGTGKNELGEEVPVEWPDKRNFTAADYEYLDKRYSEVKNPYLKTEYGLFLYHVGCLKRNEDLLELLGYLFVWSDKLWAICCSTEKNYTLIKYFTIIRQMFSIASGRKKGSEDIDTFYNTLLNNFLGRHLDWDLNFYGLMRFIVDSTRIINAYFADFVKNGLPVAAILNKNQEAIEKLAWEDFWAVIYVADETHILAVKLNDVDATIWRRITAKAYEDLAKTASNRETVAVTFIDKALRIYKEIKDDADYKRLSQEYQLQRTETQLSEIAMEIPVEAVDRVNSNIAKLITEGGTDEILITLAATPMLAEVALIRTMSEDLSKQRTFLGTMPVSVQDKFGNTIEYYSTEEEKAEFAFLQHYSMHFQIASQTILQIVIEAIKANKLNSAVVIGFLSNTWLGESAVRRVNGIDRVISHLDLLKSGIELLFLELNKWKEDSAYSPDFVASTDSLTLKVEYIFREMCTKLSIVTFKQRPDVKDKKIVMEKLFDDLIRDLRPSLGEDNYYFIKFIMSDKVGFNLRNQLAHGLMDNIEYGIESPFMVLCIILKLSMYKFETVD